MTKSLEEHLTLDYKDFIVDNTDSNRTFTNIRQLSNIKNIHTS